MSKPFTKMSRAISSLEHIYNNLNTDFFDGELPTPILTVQSKPGTKRPSSTRKLVCPCCGLSVRATKTVNILCGDCMQKMEEVG